MQCSTVLVEEIIDRTNALSLFLGLSTSLPVATPPASKGKLLKLPGGKFSRS